MEDPNNNNGAPESTETSIDDRELPSVSSSTFEESTTYVIPLKKNEETILDIPEQQALLIPQMEILLQKLQLSTVDITEVMELVLSKIQKMEEVETKKILKQTKEVSMHGTDRILRGWVARFRYKKIRTQYKLWHKLANELLDTERNFVKKLVRLNSIMDLFSQQSKLKKTIIAPETVQLIFGNLPTILNFHKEILLSMESVDITKQQPTVEQRRNQLISTFEKIVPVLPLYKPYVSTFHKSQGKLTELFEHKKFQEILELAKSSSMELLELLLAPLNRIPEYTELIGRLSRISLMDETNDNLGGSQTEIDASILAKKNKYALIDLHHQLQEMSQIIQNSIRDEENSEKVLNIQVILGDKVPSSPSRRYIREGVLRYCLENQKYHESYVYLFNDCLVVTSKPGFAGYKTQKFIKRYDLIEIQVADVGNTLREKHVFHFTTLDGTEIGSFSGVTAEEKKSWIIDITKAVNKFRIFRVPLEELWKRENNQLPTIVKETIQYLHGVDLSFEGLFRIAPDLTVLKNSVIVPIEQGKKVSFSGLETPHLMATETLKRFLRELPDAVMTAERFHQWMIVAGMDNKSDQIEGCKELLMSIPRPNRFLLLNLVKLLTKVAKEAQKNKMGSSNLAIVFSPLLLYPREASFNEMIFQSTSLVSKCRTAIQILIDNAAEIFSETETQEAQHIRVSAKKQPITRTLTVRLKANTTGNAKRTSILDAKMDIPSSPPTSPKSPKSRKSTDKKKKKEKDGTETKDKPEKVEKDLRKVMSLDGTKRDSKEKENKRDSLKDKEKKEKDPKEKKEKESKDDATAVKKMKRKEKSLTMT